jgi:hypothetical protein
VTTDGKQESRNQNHAQDAKRDWTEEKERVIKFLRMEGTVQTRFIKNRLNISTEDWKELRKDLEKDSRIEHVRKRTWRIRELKLGESSTS